ncbi:MULTISPECIES: leucine-rich repeat-containing protein kinase family protein [unclassified Shewanella]|uniref:leucine-rich repeat-containing protein kinase family protein n=1 Tax=unclassified Shewanella TaxID=196818 RepID=UPI001BBD9EBC|nr:MULTISPECIES: leucine-rich repeat-containing protein kinase family protein [unclassified Shewanella]GIU19725.1 protein kinase [Shewanella sp. MBTL60-112-B1]GIU27680.1 protein kinase [Shewanella sp. MBTL60-112-B2]
MHTIEQLTSGQLKGIKRVQIAEGLTQFPMAIFSLADSLEVLDLSGNKLSELPDNLSDLHQLKILFLTNNCFESVPLVLAKCPKLEMISFKSNSLKQLPQAALPDNTRWLILTDNKLETLPEDMGRLHQLQKLALAGNKLASLPESMANCTKLELARLSANDFKALPDWLFQLPRLSWLAVDGSPLNIEPQLEVDESVNNIASMPIVSLADIELHEVIGQGASGVIYRAKWLNQPAVLAATPIDIAVKVFKGEVTSDGYPKDELANCLQAGQHTNLIKVVAQLKQADKTGLVMELIPANYQNLGLPPSLDTCTRDTFCDATQFELKAILRILKQMASGLAHLHQNQVSHGDIYAHNTMFNRNAEILFGDFGAATNLSQLPLLQREAMEAIEVRALGCLIEDLAEHCLQNSAQANQGILTGLSTLKQACLQPSLGLRPCFKEVDDQLQQLLKLLETEVCQNV